MRHQTLTAMLRGLSRILLAGALAMMVAGGSGCANNGPGKGLKVKKVGDDGVATSTEGSRINANDPPKGQIDILGGGSASQGGANVEPLNGAAAGQTGGGAGTLEVATGDGPAPVVYPVLTFKGAGNSNYNNELFPTASSIMVNMNKQQMTLNTTSFYVNADDHQDDVNKETATMVGATVFDLVADDHLRNLAQGGFNNAGYAVFSSKAVSHKYGVSAFDPNKPLPVFPMPAPMVRFQPLIDAGQVSWASTWNGTMPVVVTMKNMGKQGDVITIQVTVNLTGGGFAHYSRFPMPQISTYVVDTAKRLVTGIVTHSLGHSDKFDKDGVVDQTYGLCTSQKPGEPVQNHGC